MKNELKSTLIYVVAGIIMGYIGFLIKNNILSLVVAIVVLVITYQVIKTILKIDKKFKWFMSNGGWIYIFIWFIVWIIFYNL